LVAMGCPKFNPETDNVEGEEIVCAELHWYDVVSEADWLQHVRRLPTATFRTAICLHSDQQ